MFKVNKPKAVLEATRHDFYEAQASMYKYAQEQLRVNAMLEYHTKRFNYLKGVLQTLENTDEKDNSKPSTGIFSWGNDTSSAGQGV